MKILDKIYYKYVQNTLETAQLFFQIENTFYLHFQMSTCISKCTSIGNKIHFQNL